jgi:hypothetical protein
MSRNRPSHGLALVLVVLLALAACGNDTDTPANGVGDAVDSGPAEPGQGVLEVDAALAQPDGTGLSVRGYVHGQHGATDAFRLCSVQLESYPPQCGGSELYVVDVDALLAQLDQRGIDLQREGDQSWTDSAVEVVGVREGPDGFQPIAPPSSPDPADQTDGGEVGDGTIEVVEPDDFDVESAPIDDDAIQQYPVSPHRAVLVDDTTLELHVWGGVDPCWALHSVEVHEDDDVVTVDLLAGTPPDSADVACIAVAVEWGVTVELDEPLDGRDVVSRY